MSPALDRLVKLITVLLTLAGLLALYLKRWQLGFLLCILAIAIFWGYYVGGKL
jgi:hypothetical protein